MLQDLKFGLKLLGREKAFTLTVAMTLALCIGANTAIFTVLHAVILEPLPFSEPDRLVALYNIYPGMGIADRGANSVPDYLDRRKLTDVFDAVTLIGSTGYDAGADGVRIQGEYVTPSYFRVLRVSPRWGRVFTEDDAVPGKHRRAILSYGLWREMFAGDRNILGKDIRLSGVPYQVVGVMPENFRAPSGETRLWVPFAFTPRQASDDARHNNSWGMLARLAPGVTVAAAGQRIDAMNRANLERFPKYRKLLEDARFATKVVGLKDELVKDVRATLYLLQAAVGFVLLIGCVNVASLLLVRSNIRMKEMAVRFSLGATRWRLGRQLLTESLALAAIGGLLGLGTGAGAVRLLAWLGARELPRGSNLQIDGAVLAFSAAVALLTGLVFGSLPVFHLMRRDLNQLFRQTERTGTPERRALWTRSVLVAVQVSLAFVLLIGSALLTVSFVRLLAVDPGFRPQHVLTAQFSLPTARYRDEAGIRNFVGGLLEGIRALPGVARAGAVTNLPFAGGNEGMVITVSGYHGAPGENPPAPGWNVVEAGYFAAIGIPVLRGRTFAPADTADMPRVAVIDQFLARKYWPRGDAIGSQIRQGLDGRAPGCTVIGIVGSVKTGDLAEQNPIGQVYFHYQQFVPRTMRLIVKAGSDDPRLAGALRSRLREADPELALFDVKTMPERVSASLLNRRAAMLICLVFAGLALALAAIGIYGVLSYTVTERTREFGIRVALGAGMRDVLGIVVGQGLKVAGVGLACGMAVALALTRLMTAMLFGVKPTDPGVFLLAGAGLMLVALVASLIPSMRAVRVRPAVAIRHE